MSIDTSSVSAEAVAGYSQIAGARRKTYWSMAKWMGAMLGMRMV